MTTKQPMAIIVVNGRIDYKKHRDLTIGGERVRVMRIKKLPNGKVELTIRKESK